VGVDDNFLALLGGAEHVHSDPQLAKIFKRFGADAFRRSSAVDVFDPFLREVGLTGKRCVEIGTYNGITSIILARYFEEVITLDIFPRTEKHAIADYLGVRNVRFVDIKDNEEKVRIIGALDFDAAYVDGNHMDDTMSDFDLVKHCGRVLFHEYRSWGTVFDLIDKLRKRDAIKIRGRFAYLEPKK